MVWRMGSWSTVPGVSPKRSIHSSSCLVPPYRKSVPDIAYVAHRPTQRRVPVLHYCLPFPHRLLGHHSGETGGQVGTWQLSADT
eukprot:1348377-Rhodomonas_salina.1